MLSKFFFLFFLHFHILLFSFDYPSLLSFFDLINKNDNEIKAYKLKSSTYAFNTFAAKKRDEWNNRQPTKDFFIFRERVAEAARGLNDLWKRNDGDFLDEEIVWLARLAFVYDKLHSKFFEKIESSDFSEYYHVLCDYNELYKIENIPFYKFSAKNFMFFVFSLMAIDESSSLSLLNKLNFRLNSLIAGKKSKLSLQALSDEGFKIDPKKMEKILSYCNMESQWDEVKKIYPRL